MLCWPPPCAFPCSRCRWPRTSSLKECEKDPLATTCIDTIGKVLEDIAVGRKPTIDLPAGPSLDKLPLADLAKLLAPKK
jgi:hypothetical protein